MAAMIPFVAELPVYEAQSQIQPFLTLDASQKLSRPNFPDY